MRRRPVCRWGLAAALALSATAALAAPPPLPVQPPEERARQQLMAQSHDPLWSVLARTKVVADVQHGVYLARNPPEVKALDGREVTVEGFMLRTDVLPQFRRFVLTRYTPVCAFCPPGAPNEAIEVASDRYLKASASGLVSVRGQLHVHDDGASGLFFSLDRAAVQ